MEPEKSVELQETTVNENGELNDQELDQVAGGSFWSSISNNMPNEHFGPVLETGSIPHPALVPVVVPPVNIVHVYPLGSESKP